MKLKLKTPPAEIETEAETEIENRRRKENKQSKQIKKAKATPLPRPHAAAAPHSKPSLSALSTCPPATPLSTALSPLLSTKPSYRNEHPPPAHNSNNKNNTPKRNYPRLQRLRPRLLPMLLPQPMLLLASNKASASCNPTQPALLQCRPRPTNPCPAGWII